MKTIKSIVLALALVSATALQANPIGDKKAKAQVEQQIGELLEGPQFEIEQDCKASVSFTVNDQNEMVVLSVDTDNDRFERYVKSRLNYKKLEAQLPGGRFYTVPLKLLSES